MQTSEIPELIDPQQAADRLRMPLRTLMEMRRDRGWPCVRSGTAVNSRIRGFTPEQIRHIIDDLTETREGAA